MKLYRLVPWTLGYVSVNFCEASIKMDEVMAIFPFSKSCNP